MNATFRNLLIARVGAAVAAASAVSTLDHAGHKGLLREIVVRELLRPLLPARAGLGHGQIISSYGEQSTEQDVVVYDREVVPSLLLDGTNGVFPIEAALYVIEVKSCLTATSLSEASEKAGELSSIKHVPGLTPPENVIPCLFAFDSDLSVGGKSELDRYQGILGDAVPFLRSLCVVGRGYWFCQETTWHTVASTPEHDEVAHFLAGILQTYSRVLGVHSSRPPRLLRVSPGG